MPWGKPAIVFCGKQTIDGDTAQVGPGIASRLGLNQLTYVARIVAFDPAAGSIEVERRAEGGVQHLSTRLPVLVTMLEGSNEMRRGALTTALAAAKAKIQVWNAAGAGIIEPAKCGLKGSPTIVKKVFAPQARAERAELIETGGSSYDQIAQSLMLAIFARQPQIESELLRFARGE